MQIEQSADEMILDCQKLISCASRSTDTKVRINRDTMTLPNWSYRSP